MKKINRYTFTLYSARGANYHEPFGSSLNVKTLSGNFFLKNTKLQYRAYNFYVLDQENSSNSKPSSPGIYLVVYYFLVSKKKKKKKKKKKILFSGSHYWIYWWITYYCPIDYWNFPLL